MNNIFNEYADFVRNRKKDELEILESLTPTKVDLMHMVIGVSGEAGELLDNIKKHIVYKQDLNAANVVEEIGDTLYYLQGLSNILGFSLEDCMHINMAKLIQRYPNETFTDHDAEERKDKHE